MSLDDQTQGEIRPYSKEVQQKIGERMRKRRKVLGITMADLAEDLDYSDVSQISKIETGDACCGTKTLYRMAQALDVSVDYLFFYMMRGWFSAMKSEIVSRDWMKRHLRRSFRS